MKKFVSLLLCLFVVCSVFSACSKNEDLPEPDDNIEMRNSPESTTKAEDETVKYIKQINTTIEKMKLQKLDKLNDKTIKSFEEKAKVTFSGDRGSGVYIYHFTAGDDIEFDISYPQKTVTFYVNDELYAQRELK